MYIYDLNLKKSESYFNQLYSNDDIKESTIREKKLEYKIGEEEETAIRKLKNHIKITHQMNH